MDTGKERTGSGQDPKLSPKENGRLQRKHLPHIKHISGSVAGACLRCYSAVIAGRLGLMEQAHEWKQAARQVKKALIETCYDEEDDFFYDVDRHGNKIKCKSISIGNLFCESLLDTDMAKSIFDRYLSNPNEFGTPFPYPSISISDPKWIQDRTGNSWGFYSQGLTTLRTLRWMDVSLKTIWLHG